MFIYNTYLMTINMKNLHENTKCSDMLVWNIKNYDKMRMMRDRKML